MLNLALDSSHFTTGTLSLEGKTRPSDSPKTVLSMLGCNGVYLIKWTINFTSLLINPVMTFCAVIYRIDTSNTRYYNYFSTTVNTPTEVVLSFIIVMPYPGIDERIPYKYQFNIVANSADNISTPYFVLNSSNIQVDTIQQYTGEPIPY